MTWTIPTLATTTPAPVAPPDAAPARLAEPQAARPAPLGETPAEALAALAGATPEPGLAGTYRCRCGKRYVTADMMFNVAVLDSELRAAVGLTHADYVCDGCLSLAETRGLTMEALHAAHGAPAEILERVRALDAQRQVLRPPLVTPSSTTPDPLTPPAA